ncbi:MAG: hypothetical protein BIFFINMI_00112 [Phycisphaerae bacterium]|nr:hypothetical protein [Phycisphaerae bacterium]
MAKMFYTQSESATKLGISVDDLKAMVRDGRLREFMDNGPVYRVEDINKMAGEPRPGDTDAVDLELVEEEGEPGKEDTVITSAGISVFDDEDLEIEADPMAQTQITQSVNDSISLESTGSGSGLLDLTREADDTSLGAELLEEIYPSAPTVEAADVITPEAPSIEPQVPAFGAPAVIESADPSAAAFSGIALVGVAVAVFLGIIVVSLANNTWPSFLDSIAEGNTPIVVGVVMAALAGAFGVVGLLIGKSTSGPRV